MDEIDLNNIELNPEIITRQSLYQEYRKNGLVGVKENIQDLADSMKALGLLQPITVYPTAYKKYRLIIGLRRFLAAKLLKWKTITAFVVM